MGAILGRLIGKLWSVIGATAISFFWDKLAKAFQSWLAARKSESDIRKKAQAEREHTEAAATPSEREEAADANRRI